MTSSLSTFSKMFALFIFLLKTQDALAGSIAFYSGSFDPPTCAHFEIIRQAIKTQNIEKLFISVNREGIKDYRASLQERLGFLKVIEKEFPMNVVIMPEPFSGKIKFVQHLQEKFPGKILQLIGQDSFQLLPSQALKDAANMWLVIPRTNPDGLEKQIPEALNVKVLKLLNNSECKDISSSLIRKSLAIRELAAVKPFLHPSLFGVFENSQLYQPPIPSQIEIQKNKYMEEFSAFKRNIVMFSEEKALPNCDTNALANLTSPAFLETQSELAWKDKFANLAIRQGGRLCSLDKEVIFKKFSSLASDSILSLQEKNYREAFTAFLQDLSLIFPDLDIRNINPPPFIYTSSRRQWVDEFIERVLTAKKVPLKMENKVREVSENILCVLTKTVCFPKIPYIEQYFPRLPSEMPRIKSIKIEELNQDKTLVKHHTLDIKKYLQRQFPVSMMDLLAKKETGIYLHTGSISEVMEFHRQDMFEQVFIIHNNRVTPEREFLLFQNKATGENRVVMGGLSSEDRFLRAFKRFQAIPLALTVKIVEHETPAPLFYFNSTGENLKFTEKDKVVIGFRDTVYERFSENKDWNIETISKAGLEITLYLNKKTGERIVNPENVYGNEMLPLLEIFYKKGIRQFYLLGTTGALDEHFNIGDALIPSSVQSLESDIIPIKNRVQEFLSHAPKNLSIRTNVTHGWMQIILQENRVNLQNLKHRGVQSIDIETYYLAKFFRDHPNTTGGAILFVSDTPFGKFDYSKHSVTLGKVLNSVYYTLDLFM